VGEIGNSNFPMGWAVGNRATLRNTGLPINADDPVSQVLVKAKLPTDDALATDGMASLMEQGLLPPAYVGGFLSQHHGGSNFLFGDGSVRLLKTTINSTVYQRLGHRADGGLIDDDAF
jgi:prepilin-type processing-associated H-X9-DG protein